MDPIIDKFYETIDKFITWICHKFGIGDSIDLVNAFEEETHSSINPEDQLKSETQKRELEMSL